MNLEDLSPELQEKIKGCATPEEMLKLAKEEGLPLSDEDLDQIAGGWGVAPAPKITCSFCGKQFDFHAGAGKPTVCPFCGKQFSFAR